jgi:hypothetical protein
LTGISFDPNRCGRELTLDASNTIVTVDRTVWNWTAVFGAQPLRFSTSKWTTTVVHTPIGAFIGIGVAQLSVGCDPRNIGKSGGVYILFDDGRISTGLFEMVERIGVTPVTQLKPVETSVNYCAQLTKENPMKTGTRIETCVDLINKTISFVIDGTPHPVAYTDIPDIDACYPIVILQESKTQIRFE